MNRCNTLFFIVITAGIALPTLAMDANCADKPNWVSSGAFNQQECPVCLQPFDHLDSVRHQMFLECTHWMCDRCFVEWQYQQQTCPLCRTDLRGPVPSQNAPPSRRLNELFLTMACCSTAQILACLNRSRDLINERNFAGTTPLYVAAQLGNNVVVKWLLAHGAIAETPTNEPGDYAGFTPLHVAVLNKYPAVIQSLLLGKADINARDRMGRTPLAVAVQQGYLPSVQLLLNNHADTKAEAVHATNPLHIAAMQGRADIVETLLQHHAPVNFQIEDGMTPLQEAATHGHSAVVEKLLAHGADANVQDENGRTALDIAFEGGHTAVTWLLMEHRRQNRSRTTSTH
ncbi:MAG TPA: ankyrin repeat domain-containing protein [Gammaproteobacteria bacterium]|nr:ankyrin repeat domain-containing protein [Gammaproteobacteria bacterium]